MTRGVRWGILFALTILSLLLRIVFDIEGVLDVDSINFGLSAFRCDLLDHQPHPPGYPGYVLFLKGLHFLVPGWGPLELAKWGSRICGAATLPAVSWAAWQMGSLDTSNSERDRSRIALITLVAASLSLVHPLLWYYASDGQSHAAEGLIMVLLFGAAAKVYGHYRTRRCLLFIVALGLGGAIRPTIVLLSLPLVLWLLWKRPWRDWLLGFLCGVLATSAWLFPLLHLAGGWELYQRNSHALMGIMFDSYSVFGARASTPFVLSNINMTLWSLLLSALPLLAVSRSKGSPWRRPFVAIGITSSLFYGLFYIFEPGYFTGLAALCCLVPATWPSPPMLGHKLRYLFVMIGCGGIALVGPSSVPRFGTTGNVFVPNLAHALEVEAAQKLYLELVRAAAGKQHVLVISDNPVTTHARLIPLLDPRIEVGVYLRAHPIQPRWDNWLFFSARGLNSVPTKVPLEPGPKVTYKLETLAEKVVIAPDASPRFRKTIRATSRCAPRSIRAREKLTLMVYPIRCLPRLVVGKNTVLLL